MDSNELKSAEPFGELVTQGMVQGRTYTCPETGRYLKPSELDTSGSYLTKKTSEKSSLIHFFETRFISSHFKVQSCHKTQHYF
jgi:leucyl-tRNA synthetase